MTRPALSITNRLLTKAANLILRFSWLIIFLFITLGAFSAAYTAEHLGIRNNTSELLSKDLPFQQVRIRLEKAFPQDSSIIIVLVESATPELVELSADWIKARIKARTDLFQSVYIPDDNPFFRKQGFLYLDLDELETLSAKLTDAQPFIGYLSKNYHFAGLTEIISLALENKDHASPEAIAPLLDAFGRTMDGLVRGHSLPVSWRQLLTGVSFGKQQNLRLLLAKPRLDFHALLPAQEPMDYLRQLTGEAVTRYPGVTLSLSGDVALEHEEMESINEDMIVASAVSLVLVLGALWLALRSFRLLFATFLTLTLGLVLTAGFAAVAVGHLNVISVAFAVLYIGLGVDFAIHLCLHYKDGRQSGMPTHAAILNSMGLVGLSLLLCALTTMIGFLAFIPTEFKGVSELGIISGAGILIGLIVSLTFLPAVLKIMPIRPVPDKVLMTLPAGLYTFPFRHRIAIRVIALLMAIAAAFTLTRLNFDAVSVNLRDPKAPSVTAFKKLLKTQDESPFVLFALADDQKQARRLADDFTRLPSVHQAVTLSSLVPEQQEEKLMIIDTLYLILSTQLDRFEKPHDKSDIRGALTKLAQTLKQANEVASPVISSDTLNRFSQTLAHFIEFADKNPAPERVYQQLEDNLFRFLPSTMLALRDGFTVSAFGIDDIPDYIRSNWISADGLHKVMVTPKNDLNDNAHLKEFVNQTLSVQPSVFGLPVGEVISGQVVVDAFIEAFSSALVLIVLLLWLLMRSLKDTLLAIVPLLLAALLTGAVNVLLNNPFNFANIIVLPLLLGMGVDSGIHMVHRLRHQKLDSSELLQSSSARGVFFSALTTLCSFTSLAFNSHLGIASMGLLLSVGITLTIICSLLVLPALSGRK